MGLLASALQSTFTSRNALLSLSGCMHPAPSSASSVRLQVINRSRATANLSFAEAAAALKQFSIGLLPVGMVALRPRDTVEMKLMFR